MCQKARKNTWRREKYAQDPDYRANQRDSTNAWLGERGGSAAYHRAYRKRRENRPTSSAVSEQSPLSGASPLSAKRDAELTKSPLFSGVYALLQIQSDGDAKRDAVLVKIDVVPGGYESITNIHPVAMQGVP